MAVYEHPSGSQASHSLQPSLASVTPAKGQIPPFQAWAELAWPSLMESSGCPNHTNPHKAIKDKPTSLILNICFDSVRTCQAISIEFNKNLYSLDLVRSPRVVTSMMPNDASG